MDARTVARWQRRAGVHCQRLHAHRVQQGQVDLGHVQADELWVKRVGGRVWQAMALAVPSRLWLGGVLSARRDGALIRQLVQQIRACARSLAILVCVDGLSSYVTAFRQQFRHPQPTGKPGRRKQVPEAGLLLGQVVKEYARRRLVRATTRAVQGSAAQIAAALAATGGGRQINTAYIERLNATFRSKLAVLGRRSRALARQEAGLTAGMYLVGCFYNFCWPHDSLRAAARRGGARGPGLARTPAMAAGLTDRPWSPWELLHYRIPPPPWVPPPRRGRPPKHPQPIPWVLRPEKPPPPKPRGRPPKPRGPDGKILRSAPGSQA